MMKAFESEIDEKEGRSHVESHNSEFTIEWRKRGSRNNQLVKVKDKEKEKSVLVRKS